jgi:hypothetical protein
LASLARTRLRWSWLLVALAVAGCGGGEEASDDSGTPTESAPVASPVYSMIEIAKGQLVGLRSDDPGVRVSTDGGRTFETRSPPADSPPDATRRRATAAAP